MHMTESIELVAISDFPAGNELKLWNAKFPVILQANWRPCDISRDRIHAKTNSKRQRSDVWKLIEHVDRWERETGNIANKLSSIFV